MTDAPALPSVANTTQRRAFRAHKRLLFDAITKQAGSVHKAIQEAVQNSIDAGSTFCRMDIDRNRIVIQDDGKGFTGTDIEEFFDVFGAPHEVGDAKFGKFRMGRGQLFTFGSNKWLTQQYKMMVDLSPDSPNTNKEDLAYDLTVMDEFVKGCRIEIDLYNPLSNGEIDTIEREIKELIRYVDIEVSLNGIQLAKNPADEKGWTVETDDAWIRLSDKGSLDVYNQGVLVTRHPASRFGTGGVVVSKNQIDVNFARTEILSSCPIWKRIRKVISENAADHAATKTTRLDVNERSAIYRRITGREITWQEVKDLKFIETVTGALLSPDNLRSRLSSHGNNIAFAPSKDVIGDKAMQSKYALVFCEEEITRMGVSSPQEFLAALAAIDGKVKDHVQNYNANTLGWIFERCQIMSMEDIRKLFGSEDYKEVKNKDLKAAEKFAIDVIGLGATKVHGELLDVVRAYATEVRKGKDVVWDDPRPPRIPFGVAERYVQRLGKDIVDKIENAQHFQAWGSVARREIRVGESDVADAWTDGDQAIWINRKLLPLVSEGQKGLAKLGSIVLHEYLHNEPDTGTHIHDEDFYSMHHDLACDTDVAGAFIDGCLERAVSLVRREQKKPSGAFKRIETKMEELTGPIFPTNDVEAFPEVNVLDFPEIEVPAYARGGM